jgi:hypothetical protein
LRFSIFLNSSPFHSSIFSGNGNSKCIISTWFVPYKKYKTTKHIRMRYNLHTQGLWRELCSKLFRQWKFQMYHFNLIFVSSKCSCFKVRKSLISLVALI